MNSLPVPVALVVVAKEPTGAVVVVVLAVIAVVKKYSPAVAFATTGPVVAVDVSVPDTVAVVSVEPVMVAPLIAAPAMVVPATSSGSEYATPTGLVFAMIVPLKIGAEAPI
jgi:hypothetical protein